MDGLIPLAFLFLLLLIVNAGFNLFCGLCLFFVATNRAVSTVKRTIPTGVAAQVENSDGKRMIVDAALIQEVQKENAEIDRMVERWTQI